MASIIIISISFKKPPTFCPSSAPIFVLPGVLVVMIGPCRMMIVVSADTAFTTLRATQL